MRLDMIPKKRKNDVDRHFINSTKIRSMMPKIPLGRAVDSSFYFLPPFFFLQNIRGQFALWPFKNQLCQKAKRDFNYLGLINQSEFISFYINYLYIQIQLLLLSFFYQDYFYHLYVFTSVFLLYIINSVYLLVDLFFLKDIPPSR